MQTTDKYNILKSFSSPSPNTFERIMANARVPANANGEKAIETPVFVIQPVKFTSVEDFLARCATAPSTRSAKRPEPAISRMFKWLSRTLFPEPL